MIKVSLHGLRKRTGRTLPHTTLLCNFFDLQLYGPKIFWIHNFFGIQILTQIFWTPNLFLDSMILTKLNCWPIEYFYLAVQLDQNVKLLLGSQVWPWPYSVLLVFRFCLKWRGHFSGANFSTKLGHF